MPSLFPHLPPFFSTAEMAAQIQDAFETILKSPKLPPDEVIALRKRIEEDQALLIQWAEEKVQLALTGHELLDSQMEQLATDISGLVTELQETGQLAEDGYGAVDDYGMELAVPEPAPSRRTGSRMQYAAYDSLDPTVPLEPRGGGAGGRKSTIPLSLSRQQSGYVSEGYPSGSDVMGWEAPKPRAGSARRGGVEGLGSRRRAASAAVQATAAAVAALEEDDFGREPTIVPEMGAYQYLEPFVPGLAHAAKEPQAPGRALTVPDIGPALIGRIAEVFWPDESNPAGSLWYLVKIESVDMASMTASIRYQNGEMEEQLSLEEVAKEGHMLLLDV